MKFLYQYRTPDNEKHDGVIFAANRDAAYAALKKRGIKPCRFDEAPGFFNKLFGKGKRWMAIGVLSLALMATLVLYRSFASRAVVLGDGVSAATVLPRHQIANLPTNWVCYVDSLFQDPVDRVFARHAQPGIEVVGRPVQSDCPPEMRGSPWVDELRRVVAGMRVESRAYLNLGKSMDDLTVFLDQRQRMEASYRLRVVRQYRSGELKMDAANSLLSAMGLELIK